MPSPFKAILLTAASAVVLAACSHGQPGAWPDASALSANPYTVLAQGGPSVLLPVLTKHLDLSADQQAALKAIAEKHHAQANPESKKARRTELKTLLLARQVDAAALRAFFDSHRAELEAKRDTHLAMLKELRAVLTDAQREKLAVQLEGGHRGAKPGWLVDHFRGMMRDRLFGDLNLTASQRQAIDGAHASLEAAHRSEAMQGHKRAFAAFLRSGDTAELAAHKPPAPPVEAIVQVATALDQAQREKLLVKLEAFGEKRHAAFHP